MGRGGARLTSSMLGSFGPFQAGEKSSTRLHRWPVQHARRGTAGWPARGVANSREAGRCWRLRHTAASHTLCVRMLLMPAMRLAPRLAESTDTVDVKSTERGCATKRAQHVCEAAERCPTNTHRRELDTFT